MSEQSGGQEQQIYADMPSQDAWESVSHTGVVGNGMFPQAYFAQGILMANAMVKESAREGFPISTFFETPPPSESIKKNFEKARDRSHKAYQIEPGPQGISVVGDPIMNVWNANLKNTRETLLNIAHLVNDGQSGQLSDFMLLNEVQSDPLFQGLLQEAERGLKSKDVRELSDMYKSEIKEFMKNPHGRDGAYYLRRKNVGVTLREQVVTVMNLVKQSMIEWARLSSDNPGVVERMKNLDAHKLLSDPMISVPHPLRNPDFE